MAFKIFKRYRELLDVDMTGLQDGQRPTWDEGAGKWVPGTPSGDTGAPDDANYLVGTANGDLSAEIVVGTSPGGELGGTWASPTVDATHSGSSHASVQAAAEATAAGALSAHASDTTGIHGIADTSSLVLTGDTRLTDSRTPTGSAGGVLGGTYPNPSFASDMATQAELDAHVNDTSDAHDASAISVADSGAHYTATDVEGVLAEIAPQLGGAPSGSAGGALDGSYPNPGLAASVAGSGLAESSDVLSVNVDGVGIEINSDTLRLKDAGVTDAKLAASTGTMLGYGTPFAGATALGSTNIFAIRVYLPHRATFSKYLFLIGTASGNMDLGIYTAAGSAVSREGSFTVPASGRATRTITAGPVTLDAGEYILAMQFNNGTASIGLLNAANMNPIAYTPTNTFPLGTTMTLTVGGTGVCLALLP